MPDLKVLLSRETIAKRVAEMGEEIARDYKGQSIIFVGVLKGAAIFLSDLARHVPLEQKMMVLCDVMKDSSRLRALRIAGARVASLNCLPACDERIFAAEGDPAVLGALRQILRTDGRKLIELRPRTHARTTTSASGTSTLINSGV